MVTIESKLNYHSLEELELMDADPYQVLINKVLKMPLKSLNKLAKDIALFEKNNK